MKYYYQLIIRECPVCGRAKQYRERVFVKPTGAILEVYYDWCDV